MKPNFEVRPKMVAHLDLAQGHPCVSVPALFGWSFERTALK
jgi:hypothetical protein